MNKKLFTIIFLAVAFILVAINNNGIVSGISEGSLLVYFLDVGQGDATLIRTPDGNDILIDGGPDDTLIKKLGQHLPLYDWKIETIILTHPHDDHLVGLVEVLNRYDVDRVVITGVTNDNSSAYQELVAQVFKRGITLEIVSGPMSLDLGGGVDFLIINPAESFNGRSVDNINNTSIVGKLIYASTSIMFTGDFEKEESLVGIDFDLKSDIYQVGHHGSSNANDRDFILAIDPDYAIISVGKNKFGHPHYRTLKNLERAEVEVMRTDFDGDVLFYSDGDEFYRL